MEGCRLLIGGYVLKPGRPELARTFRNTRTPKDVNTSQNFKKIENKNDI